MEKDKYNKWVNKYCSCVLAHFQIEKGSQNQIMFSHKEVVFARISIEEYNIFNSWTKKERLNFLNGYWNFYVAIND